MDADPGDSRGKKTRYSICLNALYGPVKESNKTKYLK